METTEMRLSQADIRQIARLVTENLLYRLNDTGMIYDPITIEEAVALTGLSKQTFYNNMNSFHHATKGKLTILPRAEVLRFAKDKSPRNKHQQL